MRACVCACVRACGGRHAKHSRYDTPAGAGATAVTAAAAAIYHASAPPAAAATQAYRYSGGGGRP